MTDTDEKLLKVLDKITEALTELKEEKKEGLLTVSQLSKRWNISETQIEENREEWQVPFIRMGKSVRYPLDSIKLWEKRNTGRAS